MTISKNFKIISTSLGVPVLFSLFLMAMVFLSIAPFFLDMNERFTYGFAGSFGALLVIYVFLKIDGKSWSDYFLTIDKETPVRFAKGTVFGLILASTMFLLQAWFSDLDVGLTHADPGQFAWMCLSLIPLAFMEELAFRSYPFFKLNKAFGVWVSQITIAVLFALYHYIGGWSLYASFMGPGVWSFAFGLLALRSNGISLPTGFHLGLNLALAAIGQKYWIPGMITIDFASTPTEEMLKSNEYFGAAMQSVVFIALLWFTYRYTRNTHGKEKSN